MTESTAVTKPVKEKSSVMLEKLLGMAKTPAERERAYLAVEQYQRNKLIQEIANEVLTESWGNKVSAALRYKMVQFALDIGADPVRHIDVLGGKPYLNAAYYMELTAAAPDFLKAEERWAHVSAEATEEEAEVRRKLRLDFGIPVAIAATTGTFGDRRRAAEGKPDITVKAACIIGLYFKERGPFFGVKWSPSRAVDDVGIDFPEPTARTRAWRKAGLQAFSPWFKAHPMIKEMEVLVEQQTAFHVPEEPTAALPPAEAEPEPPKTPQPLPAMANHAPSAICKTEGPHPLAECGYEKKA